MKVFLIALFVSSLVQASETNETFADAEANFKVVMQKLLNKYVDKKLTRDDLYKAATAGMLESLNSGTQTWNKLLTPAELQEMKADLSGQVTGIGTELYWEEETGSALVLRMIPNSPGEKSGLKKDDRILSVNGQRFKGKPFKEMVAAIRGKVGEAVELKVLREDKIVSLNVKRDIIPWKPVEYSRIDDSTGLLTIAFFNEETPKLVEKEIKEINSQSIKRLIVDLRGNSGGGFDQAVRVAEFFIPKDSMIASTVDRNSKIQNYTSKSGLLETRVTLVILTNKETFSGAELVTAALKEIRGAKVVGEPTFGKWTAQTVEALPNGYAVKYTVNSFLSPHGKSYAGTGVKPDLEVSLKSKAEPRELQLKYEFAKRLEFDTQLKAAFELAKAL